MPPALAAPAGPAVSGPCCHRMTLQMTLQWLTAAAAATAEHQSLSGSLPCTTCCSYLHRAALTPDQSSMGTVVWGFKAVQSRTVHQLRLQQAAPWRRAPLRAALSPQHTTSCSSRPQLTCRPSNKSWSRCKCRSRCRCRCQHKE